MKAARFIMKCVAFGLVVGAAACAIIAYWDKITDLFYNLADKVEEKRAACKCADCDDYEAYDEFDDWENC